jgi:hypothetical protein
MNRTRFYYLDLLRFFYSKRSSARIGKSWCEDVISCLVKNMIIFFIWVKTKSGYSFSFSV